MTLRDLLRIARRWTLGEFGSAIVLFGSLIFIASLGG